jgi:hypothetical protein
MTQTESIAGKGFGYDRLSKEKIEELQVKFSAITSGNCVTATRRWSPEKIKTVMGILNILIYRAAKEANLLIQVKKAIKFKNYAQKGFHKVVDNAMAIAARKVKRFRCGMKTVGMYLRKFWKGASSGKTTLWKFKNMLAEEFGLFRLEERQFVPGVFGKATVIEDFDLRRSLILYEHLESLLMRYAGDKDYNFGELLPEHNGAVVMLLFNRIFHGVAGYRREDWGETDRHKRIREKAENEAEGSYHQFVLNPQPFSFSLGEYYIHGWKKRDGKDLVVAFALEPNMAIVSAKQGRKNWFTRREAEPSLQPHQPFPIIELPW